MASNKDIKAGLICVYEDYDGCIFNKNCMNELEKYIGQKGYVIGMDTPDGLKIIDRINSVSLHYEKSVYGSIDVVMTIVGGKFNEHLNEWSEKSYVGVSAIEPDKKTLKENNEIKHSPADMDKAAAKLKELTEKAEQGDVDSQVSLSIKYYGGYGVYPYKDFGWFMGDKDMTKCVYWKTKAAKQGHLHSQRSLALYYYYGHGVVKDNDKSEYWLTKAAKQGCKTSIKELAEWFGKEIK